MIRNLYFLACEKLIVGQDNASSLISVLEAISVKAQVEEFESNAAIPMKWQVVTLWQRQEELKVPIEYQQRIEIINPSGEVLIDFEQTFTVTSDHLNFRNHLEVEGFPIGHEGMLTLKLYLKKSGDESEWREITDYPIRVKYDSSEQANKEPATEAE